MATGDHVHPDLEARIAALEAYHEITPPPEPPPEPPPTEPPDPPLPLPPDPGELAFLAPSGEGTPGPIQKAARHVHFADAKGTRLTGLDSPPWFLADSHDRQNGSQETGDWWYEVNGERYGQEIDTTQITDQEVFVTVEFADPVDFNLNGQVFVVNNSATPLLHKNHIHSGWFRSYSNKAIRIETREPQAVPLKWWHEKMRMPATAEDHRRLREEVQWTVEPITGSVEGLYQETPMEMLNADGDAFGGSYSPRAAAPENENLSTLSKEFGVQAERAPAYDGERGIATLSPYATPSHDHRILRSGHMGWMMTEASGRICSLDLDGHVVTEFGPRSVADRIQTDPTVAGRDLDWRLAQGEKEFVGDPALRFKTPSDGWPSVVDENHFYISDFGNDRVVLLDILNKVHVAEWPAMKPSSVWACRQARNNGVRFLSTSENTFTIHWLNGTSTEWPIPGATWVRGKESDSDPTRSRVYIMTLTLGFYEYDLNHPQSPPVMVQQPASGLQNFALFDVDAKGVMGARGNIRFAGANSFKSNTAPGLVQPKNDGSLWEPFVVWNDQPKWQITSPDHRRGNDWWGHYLWAGGGVTHHHLCAFLTTGAAESGWLLWRGYLDEQPKPVPLERYPGRNTFNDIYADNAPLEYLFGNEGGGRAGHSLRSLDYRTKAEAMAIMEPYRPPNRTDKSWADEVEYALKMSCHNHFE